MYAVWVKSKKILPPSSALVSLSTADIGFDTCRPDHANYDCVRDDWNPEGGFFCCDVDSITGLGKCCDDIEESWVGEK